MMVVCCCDLDMGMRGMLNVFNWRQDQGGGGRWGSLGDVLGIQYATWIRGSSHKSFIGSLTVVMVMMMIRVSSNCCSKAVVRLKIFSSHDDTRESRRHQTNLSAKLVALQEALATAASSSGSCALHQNQ
jgi:hypothetical protein